ncbi:hypothetical protein [Micromonospora sp. CPCC 206061]|uniref:hypothetical protein n=1 Tax=Micromonospora sp. CPCC 206061 TaxID=3122410 RepID=UPI002FF0C96A
MTTELENRREETPQRPLRRTVFARAVTDALQPPAVLVVAMGVVAATSATTVGQAFLWGVPAVLFGGVLPFLFILIGVRRGRLSDVHIRVRHQRHIPLAVALASVLVGLAILYATDAPRPLTSLFIVVLLALLPCMAITVWWQISAHAAFAAAVAVYCIALWGPWLAFTAAAVALVGWSRIELRAHTMRQVLAGAALGAITGCSSWLLLT